MSAARRCARLSVVVGLMGALLGLSTPAMADVISDVNSLVTGTTGVVGCC